MAAVFGDVHQCFSWLIFMYRKSSLMFYWWRRSAYENVAVTISVPKSIYEWPFANASQNFQFFTNCWKALFECLTSQTGVITNRYIFLPPYIWQYNIRQYTRRFSLTVEQIFVFTVSTYFVREVKNLPRNFKQNTCLMLWNVFASIGRSILLLNCKLIFGTFYRGRGQQLYSGTSVFLRTLRNILE